MRFFILLLLSSYVFAQEEKTLTFTSDFTSTVVDTPTPSTYKPYQAQLDKSDQTGKTILLSVVAPNSAPAEFGSVDLTYNNYTYTTLYGDVSQGNIQGIVDGIGKDARIREIRCFTQTADGSTIYFGDRYVLRQIDRASGNVTSLLGDPSTAVDNFTSWDAVTFDNINGIVYDNDTGFLYINTDTKGLVAFDLPNRKFSIVLPLADISSPDSNDYGADLIISPDRQLYMKVSQGVNRYNLSDISNIDTDTFNLNDTRWISSIDRSATYQEQNYTFGSTFFGRLGLSFLGGFISMVDHEQKYPYIIDRDTGIVNRTCYTGSFSNGNTSVCAFTEPYSSLWVTDNPDNNGCANGTLFIFHYYSASRSNRRNYVAVATLEECKIVDEVTTTTTEPTTTTTEPTTTTTDPTTSTTTDISSSVTISVNSSVSTEISVSTTSSFGSNTSLDSITTDNRSTISTGSASTDSGGVTRSCDGIQPIDHQEYGVVVTIVNLTKAVLNSTRDELKSVILNSTNDYCTANQTSAQKCCSNNKNYVNITGKMFLNTATSIDIVLISCDEFSITIQYDDTNELCAAGTSAARRRRAIQYFGQSTSLVILQDPTVQAEIIQTLFTATGNNYEISQVSLPSIPTSTTIQITTTTTSGETPAWVIVVAVVCALVGVGIVVIVVVFFVIRPKKKSKVDSGGDEVEKEVSTGNEFSPSKKVSAGKNSADSHNY